MHRTTIIGHIGGEIVLRNTIQNPKPVCNFSVCVNDKWTDKVTGQKRERAQWYRCVAWNGLALTIKEHMASGRQVCVEGRMQESDPFMMAYKDVNGQTYVGGDGLPLQVKRTKWELVCSNVEFLGKNPNSNAYAAPGTVVQPAAAVAVAAPVAVPAATFVQPAPAAAPLVAPVVAAGPAAVAGTFVAAPAAAPAGTVPEVVVVAPTAGV